MFFFVLQTFFPSIFFFILLVLIFMSINSACECNHLLPYVEVGQEQILVEFIFHKFVYLVGIYLLKVNNRNTRTRCEICTKLTIKTPERRQSLRSGIFIVNFIHISHLDLLFLLLSLNM